jgi:hypothetical protein
MTLDDHGLDNLLALDGEIIEQADGFWVKFDAKQVEPSIGRPHGIKYSLSLHDESGKRILGFDNAHAISEGRGYSHRHVIEYDHEHRLKRQVIPYTYRDAEQLMVDFWDAVDTAIESLLRE